MLGRGGKEGADEWNRYVNDYNEAQSKLPGGSAYPELNPDLFDETLDAETLNAQNALGLTADQITNAVDEAKRSTSPHPDLTVLGRGGKEGAAEWNRFVADQGRQSAA